MSWLHFNTRIPQVVEKDRFATTQEMQETFDLEQENLRWIAFIITGDPVKAEKATVDASGLRRTSSGVFRDWLTRWAHSSTARVAAQNVREQIAVLAPSYADWACEHSDHELLSEDQILAIRQWEPQQLIVNLDPFSRSILVLRGIQHASISDCSILLNVPRRSVVGAYCRALGWLREYAQSESGPESPYSARPSESAKGRN